MAKRSRAPTPPPADDAEYEEVTGERTRTVRTMTEEQVPVRDEGGEEENPLDTLLAELGGGTDFDIAVYRMDKTKPNGRIFCGPLQAGGLNNSSMLCTRLQQEYGGGDFFIQVKDPESGHFIRRVVVSVEAPKAAALPPAAVMQDSLAAAISAALAPMQAAMVQMQQRPQFDFGKLLAQGMAALPLIQGVRGLFAPAGGGDMLSSLKAMKEVRELMEDSGMSGREPDGMDRVIKLFENFGKPLLAAVENAKRNPRNTIGHATTQMAPRPLAGGAVRVNMGGMPGIVAPTTPVPVPPEVSMLLPQIVQLAKSGTLPADAAELMYSVIPDERIDEVANALESGLVETLAAMPEFDGMRPWLVAVANSFLEGLTSEGQDEGTDVPDDPQAAATDNADGDS